VDRPGFRTARESAQERRSELSLSHSLDLAPQILRGSDSSSS
jgi:hypothetical protein